MPLSRDRKYAGRRFGVGLVVVWLGILFYLTQRITMPLELWLAYSVAGLGAALVVWGLILYSSRTSIPERHKTKVVTAVGQKPAPGFSGQLGIQHDTVTGRKILFEFDPSTPYHAVIREFALECVSNKEMIVVLTPSGSVIQHALQGDKAIEIINLAHDTMLSPILEKHTERPLNLVYDSLTDLALSTDAKTAYGFSMNSLRQLSDPGITTLFLLNPSAHEQKDVSSLRGLFSNQVAYGKEGMRSIKLA